VVKILGIDPSLCNTGWGMIEILDNVVNHIDHGVIKTKAKLSTEKRLSYLSIETEALIKQYQPDVVCLEETYCGINPITTLRLGFASGALLCMFGTNNLPVFRYPTRLVKWLITDNGASSKPEVRDKVIQILAINDIASLDSSDALAVAIAHHLHQNRN
jgi:crossover junction endodeoxyribonuclease RuvC